MKEAMGYLQKDVASLLKPVITERITRKTLSNDDVGRVKILHSTKMKVPGSHAVPYAAAMLTILVLAYKSVYIEK